MVHSNSGHVAQNIASAKEESAEAVQGHQGKEQSEPKVQHGERALLAN